MQDVDCSNVRARILEAGDFEDPALQRHVAACPACATLVEDDVALGGALRGLERSAEAGVDDLLRSTLDAVSKPPGIVERVRQQATGSRVAALGVGALIGIAVVAGLSRRVDLAVYPLPRLALSVALLGGVIAWAGAALVRPLHRARPAAWIRRALPWAALAAPVLIAALPAAHLDHPASLAGAGADFVPRALACFVFGAVWAAMIGALGWLVDRSGLELGTRAITGMLGAAAFGNLVLVLHCPLTSPLHKLAGHAGVSVAFLVVGASLAWYALRRRLK